MKWVAPWAWDLIVVAFNFAFAGFDLDLYLREGQTWQLMLAFVMFAFGLLAIARMDR